MKHFKIFILMFMCFAALPLSILYAQPQAPKNINISSTVTDKAGNPITGALVSGDEGKTVQYTAADGSFTINVAPNSTVLISAAGYKAFTFRVNQVAERIVLQNDNGDVTVNLPFSKVSSKDRVAAISYINPTEFMDKDYNLGVEAGMNGRVAGLMWSNNIWGMENALVMIDGIRRDFSDITLNEVEQITVLKGVNAVALYGAQAAKGVILITSKRGDAFNRKINVRANGGAATPISYPKYLGSADYMTLYNEARRNDGLQPTFSDAQIEGSRTGNRIRYPDVDYYSSDYLKKYIYTTDAVAEFSGGNNNAKFYSNIGYANNSTLLNFGSGNREMDSRFNIRGNVDITVNKYISSSIDISGVFYNNFRGAGNYWSNAAVIQPHKFAPLIPIDQISPNDKASLAIVGGTRYVVDGKYLMGGSQEFLTNPFASLAVNNYTKNIRRVFQLTQKIDVNLEQITKGLSFHTMLNADYGNSFDQSFTNQYAVFAPNWRAAPVDTISSLSKLGNDIPSTSESINNTTQRQNIGLTLHLDYVKSYAGGHNVTGMLLASGSSIRSNGVFQPLTNTHSALQLGYNYKQKYWFDFTGAYTNSAKLPDGNRTGFSPTASIGWLLSGENFMANAKAVDYLKLTAAAGIVNTDLDIRDPNSGAEYFLYDGLWAQGSTFPWRDDMYRNQAYTSQYGANPGLFFAKRKEVNIGLEGLLFNRAISFEVNYFNSTMDGLPVRRFSQYPAYYSQFVPWTNYNANRRSGFDLRINYNKKVGAVDVSAGFIATYSTSKATKREELNRFEYLNRAGRQVDAIFGLESLGFFADQNDINNSPRQAFGEVKPGDIKYRDQNGDGVIDQLDEVQIGRWVAPLNLAFNASASYKGFTLFAMITSNFGGDAMRSNNYFWVDGDKKYSEVVNDRWTEATKATATYPRLSSLQNVNNNRNSDFWLYNTNRVNLSKLQLFYNFPSKLFANSFVRDLGVYLNGSNLLVLGKNKDLLQLNIASAPQMRYFNFGVRAHF